MKRHLVAIAIITATVIFTLTAYWWRTANSSANFRSISSLLSPQSPWSPATSVTSLPSDTFAIRDKVAVIVETRPLRTLIPLILHFASVLGPEWPVLFLTRASTVRTLEAFGQGSQPFKRMVKSGQVKIIELPSDAYLQFYVGISAYYASEQFWAQMGPAKHMLMFQTDSIICSNSGTRVEDFLEYDFVGAPHPFIAGAFNGGLSLRNVTLAREVISRWNIADDIVANGTDLGLYEDVWFWTKMGELNGRFPTPQKASEFAVDYIWAERPLGFHGINKGVQIARTEDIYTWCPEAALAADRKAVELNEAEAGQKSTVEDVKTPGGKILTFG